MAFNYFKITEFASPDDPTSGFKMNKHFVELLDQARGIAGCPFRVSSGYRTEAYNRKLKGSVSNSSHCKGLAVDLVYKNNNELYLILNALMKVGMTRFGISFKSKFIHVDMDISKVQNTIWTYNY
tara:strand:+ start:1125 stop:1499 length:375 start_codon:yes stop_codon:yes gene_type:complete